MPGKYLVLGSKTLRDRRAQWLVLMTLLLISFLLAFSIRLSTINKSPVWNNWIDLKIYLHSGELIANGINPYNSGSGGITRAEIERRSSKDIGPDRSVFDMYVSSNPPLATIVSGLVVMATSSDWLGADEASIVRFRIAYAFLESLIAPIILLILFFRLNSRAHFSHITAFASLAIIPLPLLKWGTYLMEDKGIEVLLMLIFLYCFTSKNEYTKYILGALFGGLSVSFKVLGVVFIPWVCWDAYFFYRENKSSHRRKLLILAAAIAVISTAVWIVPFAGDIGTMIQTRLLRATIHPIHSSIWTLFYSQAHSAFWKNSRMLLAIFVLSMTTYGFAKKKIGWPYATAAILMVLVPIWLQDGSLDRYNAAILPAIVLVYLDRPTSGLILCVYYILGYVPMLYQFDERLDAAYLYGFVILFVALLVANTYRKDSALEARDLIEESQSPRRSSLHGRL